MTLETDILNLKATPVFLVTTTAGKLQKFWKPIEQDSYVCTTKERVGTILFNGVELTRVNTWQQVEATPGSFSQDKNSLYFNSDRAVYVHLPAGEDPRKHENSVVLFLKFYFSNLPKNLDGHYWEPFVQSVPDLSLRIEEKFGDFAQIGGGTVALQNLNGYFDSLADLDWDAGTTNIKMGIDRPGYEMPFAEYKNISTWLNDSHKISNTEFDVTVREYKANLEVDFPFDVYTRTEYPFLLDGDIGRPKQVAYGEIYGAAPVCINYADKRFKLATHRIHAIKAARQATNTGWEPLTISSKDLENGEFVSLDWDGESSVSVDFYGLAFESGALVNNPADIVADLLARFGETNLDATSFSEARRRYIIGTDENGNTVSSVTPSLYIYETTTGNDLIQKINSTCYSFLYADASGFFKFVKFEPMRGEGLQTIYADESTENSFLDERKSKNECSQLVVSFSPRISESWEQVLTVEEPSFQYQKNKPSKVSSAIAVDLADPEQAIAWAQKQLLLTGKTPSVVSHSLPWSSFLIEPSTQVRYVNKRHSRNLVMQVLEKSISLQSATAKVLLDDLHAFKDSVGFWVGDADVLPPRFANLAGYGDGGLTWNIYWASEIKEWARQNVGYWTDENGFAHPDDPESYMPSSWF